MRLTRLIAALAVPMLVIACDHNDPTAPADRDLILVWSPNGYWVNVGCTHIAVNTQSEHGNVISMSHFTVPNDSRRAVTYSNDNPPVPYAICYDGALRMYLPNWVEHVSASGRGYLKCWAP
jgi:hypothetical protein